MARITDKNKIERLKQSTMKLVVENGFGGASAALISKDAGVAAGYFYIHYKGKYEMVNAIFQEVYQEFIILFEEMEPDNAPFFESIETIIHRFVKLANTEPIKVKFLYVLSNDYSFAIDPTIRENNFQVIKKLKERGQKSNCLDTQITEDDLYLILFINSLQYINQRFKKSHNKEVIISELEEKHLFYLITKFLK
jgi:AcrR family transcriptional regulator